jgi:hypothetical protein
VFCRSSCDGWSILRWGGSVNARQSRRIIPLARMEIKFANVAARLRRQAFPLSFCIEPSLIQGLHEGGQTSRTLSKFIATERWGQAMLDEGANARRRSVWSCARRSLHACKCSPKRFIRAIFSGFIIILVLSVPKTSESYDEVAAGHKTRRYVCSLGFRTSKEMRYQ